MQSPTPDLPSACAACRYRPCTRGHREGLSIGAPIVVQNIERVASSCPALIRQSEGHHIQSKLRLLSMSEREQARKQLRVTYANQHSHVTLEAALIHAIARGMLQILIPDRGPGFGRASSRGSNGGGSKKSSASPAKDSEFGSTQNLKSAVSKARLTAPEWVWIDDPKMPGSDESTIEEAAMRDAVFCKVATTDMMPGDSIAFKVFLKGRDGQPDIPLQTVMGQVGACRKDEAAVGRLILPGEANGKPIYPKMDKLIFEATSFKHNLNVKSPALKILPKKPSYMFSC